jgi:hypothetical protein
LRFSGGAAAPSAATGCLLAQRVRCR